MPEILSLERSKKNFFCFWRLTAGPRAYPVCTPPAATNFGWLKNPRRGFGFRAVPQCGDDHIHVVSSCAAHSWGAEPVADLLSSGSDFEACKSKKCWPRQAWQLHCPSFCLLSPHMQQRQRWHSWHQPCCTRCVESVRPRSNPPPAAALGMLFGIWSS